MAGLSAATRAVHGVLERSNCSRYPNKEVSASAAETIRISIPKCDPGIGQVIRTPDSADLIEGVVVRPYDLWPDDRGYFLEVARMGQGLAADFPRRPRRFPRR